MVRLAGPLVLVRNGSRTGIRGRGYSRSIHLGLVRFDVPYPRVDLIPMQKETYGPHFFATIDILRRSALFAVA